MKVELKYLESLSKLKITDDKESFEKDFERILDFVDEIAKLELPEGETKQAIDVDCLREDVVVEQEKCDVLLNAPKKLDGCYVAPLVVE